MVFLGMTHLMSYWEVDYISERSFCNVEKAGFHSELHCSGRAVFIQRGPGTSGQGVSRAAAVKIWSLLWSVLNPDTTGRCGSSPQCSSVGETQTLLSLSFRSEHLTLPVVQSTDIY